MDFPLGAGIRPVISSMSSEANGASVGGAAGSGTWPSANLAIFVPFSLCAPYRVTKLWWANGATVSGNVDCGVYSPGGVLLVSAGATAQATISVIQSVTLGTPFLLEPGAYYMALACSSGTATMQRAATVTNLLIASGIAQQATAEPLPATFTLATAAQAYTPLFGIGHPVVI